jgi:hypothetical protein
VHTSLTAVDLAHAAVSCKEFAPVDADVAPVADLLRQVGGVENELGLEEGVLPAGNRTVYHLKSDDTYTSTRT